MRPKIVLILCRANVARSPFFAAALSAITRGSNIRVISRGIESPSVEPYATTREASRETRKIAEKFAHTGEMHGFNRGQLTRISDQLNRHRAQILTEGELRNADLVLTMEPKLNQTLMNRFGQIPGLEKKVFTAPEYLTRVVHGRSNRLSKRGNRIKDPVKFENGKKMEAPAGKERAGMHAQQLRIAYAIARHWTGQTAPARPIRTPKKIRPSNQALAAAARRRHTNRKPK